MIPKREMFLLYVYCPTVERETPESIFMPDKAKREVVVEGGWYLVGRIPKDKPHLLSECLVALQKFRVKVRKVLSSAPTMFVPVKNGTYSGPDHVSIVLEKIRKGVDYDNEK